MGFIKAEIIKWGAAPGDSNAERLTIDVFEIYRDQIDQMGLRSKGRIITIIVEEIDPEAESTSTGPEL